MSALGVLIVLAVCGLSGFFVVADELRDRSAEASGRADAERLAARTTDPAPLTLGEVFPGRWIRPAPGSGRYAVGTVHAGAECRAATLGRLGAVLDAYGCSQVIRAAMVAPYGGYRVTAGVVNLPDAAAAARSGAEIRRLVESGEGSFAALESGGWPPAQVGWREHGHYLVYCVISRPDARVVRDDDPYAERITVDLVEWYLIGQVLGRRGSSQPPRPLTQST